VRRRTRFAGLAAALLALAACTRGGSAASPPLPSTSGPALLYVAVGASDSVGAGTSDPLRQAWPQVLFRTGLPARTRMVVLGVPGSTVSQALAQQVPEATALHPDLVTVWLSVNDLVAGVSPDDYGRALEELLRSLRGGGGTEVLVANTPPLDRMPAYLSCAPFVPEASGSCDRSRTLTPAELQRRVAEYNVRIESAARATGAVLVDLHALGLGQRAAGTEDALFASDGFHPSPEGAKLIATAFRAALQQAGGPFTEPASAGS
jgi:lysophospholipase L1-like esterase